MKIIIIGAGVGGLATYKFIQKLLPSEHSIKIYESYKPPSTLDEKPSINTSTIGGGLGIAPNGMRVLHSLDPGLAAKIIAQGKSQSLFTFRNSSGATLGRLSHGSGERYGGFSNVMIARQDVHDTVREGVEIEYGKRVAEVKEVDGQVEVVFVDGQIERADLVLGADGVRSAVRRSIMGKEYDAVYNGLTGTGGFLSTSLLSESLSASLNTDAVVMTFSRCGFFGYAACNTNLSRIMWWSTFPIDPAPSRETYSDGQLRTQLLERHENWLSPVKSTDNKPFREIIDLACDPTKSNDRVLLLPVYHVPELPAFVSESGRIVLLGDAAHAMPPDSGQGLSQALEDAETIVLLLSKILPDASSESEALKKVAQLYNSLRKPRVDALAKDAQKRGNRKRQLSWWDAFIRDLLLRIVCLLPESWLANNKKFGYDVSKEVELVLKK